MGLKKLNWLLVYLALCNIHHTMQQGPFMTNEYCFETAYVEYVPNPEYEDYDNVPQTIPHANYVKVTCSSVNLTSEPLPLNNPRRFSCLECDEELTIKDSLIPSIPPSAFSNYPSTTILNITRSRVEKILPGAFNFLTSLKELYLSDNNLTYIPDGVLNALVHLQILDLSNNNIENLSMHGFTGVTGLDILNLSSNALQYIDSSSLIHMKQLSSLDLSFNRIKSFNFTLISDKVQYLNLSHNHVNSFIGCWTTLISLDLSINLLTKIENDKCPSNVSNIATLNLEQNFLSSLKYIPNLNALSHLSLANNTINYIPSDFFSKLNKLVFLNLSLNELDQFQYGLFDGLLSLTKLDLSKNHLTAFKRYSYHLLRNLVELYVNDNEISVFESKDITQVLPHLQTISLNRNNFTCDKLISIFHDLSKISIIRGQSFSTNNIHGIACSEVDYSLDTSPNQNYYDTDSSVAVNETLRTMLNRILNIDFTKSSVYKYFNTDFKKSNFYKYLENLIQVSNVTMKNYDKDVDIIKSLQKSQYQFNRNISDYFNSGFKNSTFVKYFENFKNNTESWLNNGFSKSTMYNYFNKDFVNSNFYKYLEALKKPQFAIKYSENQNDTKVEKLIGNFSEIEEKSDNSALLVVIILLLVVISCIMLCFMYISYTKIEKIMSIKNEQVELLEA